MISRSLLAFAAGAAVLCASFVLADPAPQAPAAAPDSRRLPAIDGANNFRDLGGYQTVDGRHVRWGVLYRSASLGQVTVQGFNQLKRLGVKTNIDFRSTSERKNDPVVWPADSGVAVYSEDYETDTAAFAAFFTMKDITADKARAAMAQFYKVAPFQFAGQYRRLFRQILDQQTPVVYNCTAGKDRTGLASALILTVLGVPRDAVVGDYLLSNRYYRPQRPKPGAKPDPAMMMFMRLPPDVVQAIMGVDASYLQAAFAAIEARDGGFERYVREDLGLSAADQQRLKALLLE